MNKRLAKKTDEIKTTIKVMERLEEHTAELAQTLQNNMTRITWLLKENTSLISRFPTKVEDWLTNPPIHSGQYVIYFIRKAKTIVRMYTLVGGVWKDSQGQEVDIKALRPSLYFTVPMLADGIEDLYRRRES